MVKKRLICDRLRDENVICSNENMCFNPRAPPGSGHFGSPRGHLQEVRELSREPETSAGPLENTSQGNDTY